ncbi:MAG: family 78 glycoside hydrolase catalytic domain, partial [Gemmatimonadota bacterium]|nr:family 78 glycoside hydrolase catalytic domain [Gemmatimonadota bacterium]
MARETESKRVSSWTWSVLFAVLVVTVFILHDSVTRKNGTLPPSGLMCELMEYPGRTVIEDPRPELGWIVNSALDDDIQTAYRVLVASSLENLKSNTGDMWDTGRVESAESMNIEYSGRPLEPEAEYFWKVRTWNRMGEGSPYSAPQGFRTGRMTAPSTACYPLEKHEIRPVRVVRKGPGHYFIDFGKAAFGTVKMTLTGDSDRPDEVEVHLGEVPTGEDAIDRSPGGSMRYRKMILPLREGTHTYTVSITPDKRNTGRGAIRMPPDIGEVMPFRYCEIIGCPSELDRSMIAQVAVNYPFNDSASGFSSSSKVLDDVWELCKYSIKATSFCGIYVDGDRERIPYEADAYINQLCHYCVDREFTIARRSHEYLITHPSWPTEWILHSVLMAWADYLYTGNDESIERYYEDLKAKTLLALAREDGLVSTRTGLVTEEVLKSIHFSGRLDDIVDWPKASFGGEGVPGERDGYVMTDINTVVNAFLYQALVLMGRIAGALERDEDAEYFRGKAEAVKRSINEKLLDRERGVYLDGEGTDHASLHANMFPLTFGLVPAEYRESVVDFIKSRGMACSVYGAQYLLEALYLAGEADYALRLMISTSERSWAHMIYDVGTTITLEAWDSKYKPNLDWNHAWGAAPANLLPRFVLGVEPLEPGWSQASIRPSPGDLTHA